MFPLPADMSCYLIVKIMYCVSFFQACPMLEQLLLKDCRLRNEGLGPLLQGMKMANLLNLRELNLRGNFLSGRGIEYLHETCRTGILTNLQVLILSDNELHDGNFLEHYSVIVMVYFLAFFDFSLFFYYFALILSLIQMAWINCVPSSQKDCFQTCWSSNFNITPLLTRVSAR